MAVSSQQILDFLFANQGMSDAQIVAAMEQYGVSPAQMANAVGIPEAEVIARVAEVVPPNQAVLLGDTWVQPQYQIIGSGEDQQVGSIQSIQTYKTSGGVNDQVPVGTTIQNFTPEGEFTGSSKTTSSGQTSFFGGLVDAFKDPVVQAAILGVAGGAGVFENLLSGGAPTALGAEGLLTGGSSVAGMGAGTGLSTANTGLGISTSGGLGTLGTGAGLTAGELGVGNTLLGGSTLGSTLSGLSTGVGAGLGTTLAGVGTGVGTNLLTNAGTNLLGNAVTGGLGLTGGVLQQQQSREAATTAAQNVNTATQAGVTGSQFRPVGMTTRFGTSNYTYDPVTGRMTSAGYQLSPEAKAQQDRFATMANYSLTQAENAQSQFAPLQTGAQNLFGLGNQYISQSPQDVAQNYINQQMKLLQPSREVELANLQNRLYQQGRTGVSVAQGGTMGATTPELQALYNARAQQEAVLAANAQQAGQQNVLFGAGLLGQGTNALNQYFGGQVAAYQPYQAAMGQVQNLESLGQQPLQMGATLGQQSATAGANAGRIGLTGAQISGNLMTSPAVTNNPYAAFLSGLGSPTSTLGQGLANYITGYNPTADQNAVLNPYLTPTSVWYG